MVYEYECSQCSARFDVIKRASEMENEEHCRCGELAIRKFVPSRLYFSGTRVQEAEYNPGLGCIVKNKQQRAEICKQRGLIEVGNEKPESIEKQFAQTRHDKWEKSWADADKGWVGCEG